MPAVSKLPTAAGWRTRARAIATTAFIKRWRWVLPATTTMPRLGVSGTISANRGATWAWRHHSGARCRALSHLNYLRTGIPSRQQRRTDRPGEKPGEAHLSGSQVRFR